MALYAVVCLNSALLLAILLRGWKQDLYRRYAAFFSYAAYQLICTVASAVIMGTQGIQSESYRVFFYATTSVTPALQAWVLLSAVHRLTLGRESEQRLCRGIPFFALALSAPVYLTVSTLNLSAFLQFQAVTLVFQMVFCLLLYCYLLERRDLRLGANLGGILTGTALMVGCQSLNFLGYFNERIPFEVFQFLVPVIYAGALVIFLVGFWEHAPVRLTEGQPDLNPRLQQGIRLILRSLLPR